MRKILLMVLVTIVCSTLSQAQWQIGGNNVTSNSTLGLKSNYDLSLITNDVARLTITKSGTIFTPGKLGVGSSSINASKFLVQGNVGGTVAIFKSAANATGIALGGDEPGVYFNSYVTAGGVASMSNSGYSNSIDFDPLTGALSFNFSQNAATAINQLQSFNTRMKILAQGTVMFTPDSNASAIVVPNLQNGVGFYCNKEGNNAAIYVDKNSTSSTSPAVDVYCNGGPGFRAASAGNYGIIASSTTNYAGYFIGDIYTTGSYLPSDSKLKNNVESFANAMNLINKIPVKTYEYRTDGLYEFMHFAKGQQIGIMAQDLENVLPGLVRNTTVYQSDLVHGMGENRGEEINYKAVNYVGLVPILVAAIQEQNVKSTEMDARITMLENRVKQQRSNSTIGALAPYTQTKWLLEQNTPNPFNQTTVIKFRVADANQAEIMIRDLKGHLLKSYDVQGKTEVSINANELMQGTYTYTLIVDNNTIDTKIMIITR